MKPVPIGPHGGEASNQQRGGGTGSRSLRQGTPEGLMRLVESVGRQRSASAGSNDSPQEDANGTGLSGGSAEGMTRERLREILQAALDVAEGVGETGDDGDEDKSAD